MTFANPKIVDQTRTYLPLKINRRPNTGEIFLGKVTNKKRKCNVKNEKSLHVFK